MRKTKKWLASFMATITLTGALTACGRGDAGKGPGADSEKNQTEISASKEADDELEYVKLKFISVGETNAETTATFLETVNKMLMEDLNCEIEVQYMTMTEHPTKYPLVVSSGEEYDVIFTASWTNYGEHALNGAYMELTEEMLAEYSPMYYELCKDNFNEVKVDGKMYMYMQTDKGTNSFTYYGVRGDLMKEAELTEITTPEQMEQYLDYVVQNRPDMNILNASTQTNGLFIRSAAQWLIDDELKYNAPASNDYFMGAAGSMSKINAPYIMDTSDPSNLKYVDQKEVDEHFLKIFHKVKEMQQKGYWDEDCLSRNGSIEDFYVAGTGAAALRQMEMVESWVYGLQKTNPEAEPMMVRLVDYPDLAPAGNSSGAAISANSKNWERAMMVCDLFHCDPDYIKLIQFGIEGTHYTMNENGTVHIMIRASKGHNPFAV